MNARYASDGQALPDSPGKARATLEVVPAASSQGPTTPDSGQPAHVLVCLDGDALDLELIRQGRVLAGRLRARLTLLYPFCPGEDDCGRQVLTRDRDFARSAGAALVELPVYSAEEGIVEYARSRGVTHLVLGDRGCAPWYAAWRDGVPEKLAKQLDRVDLYLVSEPVIRRRPSGL